MSKQLHSELYTIIRKVYWADTHSRVVITLGEIADDLNSIDERLFSQKEDLQVFRYICHVATEYRTVELEFSSDVLNEVRDALDRLLQLYHRLSSMN